MVSEFEKTFKILSKNHEPTILFNDFLDYFIDQFMINPSRDKLFHHESYDESEYKLFYQLMTDLVLFSQQKFEEHGWFDVLGYFYEELIQTKLKSSSMGQFFTPISVTDLLAKLTMKDSNEVQYVYDPAVGSGRTLLAHHMNNKYDICVGWDLDVTSVKMCTVNFILHGVKGCVCHIDSLSMEFFTGFKVNEFVDYGTPMTVMRCDSLEGCLCFMGVDNDTGCLVEDMENIQMECINNDEDNDDGMVNVHQTTLI